MDSGLRDVGKFSFTNENGNVCSGKNISFNCNLGRLSATIVSSEDNQQNINEVVGFLTKHSVHHLNCGHSISNGLVEIFSDGVGKDDAEKILCNLRVMGFKVRVNSELTEAFYTAKPDTRSRSSSQSSCAGLGCLAMFGL